MIGESAAQTRLCPDCANSIAADAANCPYCKAEVSSQPTPQWLKRDTQSSQPRTSPGSLFLPDATVSAVSWRCLPRPTSSSSKGKIK
jgi:hypothetical protein